MNEWMLDIHPYTVEFELKQTPKQTNRLKGVEDNG